LLGDGASLHQAAKLGRLDLDSAYHPAGARSRENARWREPISFVYALIGSATAGLLPSAVPASVSALARSKPHRRAAMILLGAGAAGQSVAVHLLEAQRIPIRAQSRRFALRSPRSRESGGVYGSIGLVRQSLKLNCSSARLRAFRPNIP
jgi:hypothetical protein